MNYIKYQYIRIKCVIAFAVSQHSLAVVFQLSLNIQAWTKEESSLMVANTASNFIWNLSAKRIQSRWQVEWMGMAY